MMNDFLRGSTAPGKKRIVRLSADLFIELLRDGTEHHFKMIRGLPEDSRIVDVRFDPVSHLVELYVESGTFPDLPEGAFIDVCQPLLASELSWQQVPE